MKSKTMGRMSFLFWVLLASMIVFGQTTSRRLRRRKNSKARHTGGLQNFQSSSYFAAASLATRALRRDL